MNQKEQEAPQPTTIPPIGGYPPPYGYFPQKDEMSLNDLLGVLLKNKMIIFGITVIATVGAVIYALSLPIVYKAESTFLPPLGSDIQALNISGYQIDSIGDNKLKTELIDSDSFSINSVYKTFRKNLYSKEPRRSIFEKMGLLDIFEPKRDEKTDVKAIVVGFTDSFSVTTTGSLSGDTVPTISLAMEGGDPELIAEIVNRVGSEVEQQTKTEIISNINAKIAAKINHLTREIKLLRDSVRQKRLDEIERLELANHIDIERINVRIAISKKDLKSKKQQIKDNKIKILKEAAMIARALNIKYSVFEQNTQNMQNQLGTSKFYDQLYDRGYKALEAEIEVITNRESDNKFNPEISALQERLKSLENNLTIEQLKSRKNDDPFIESLRDVESELKRMKSIHIDPETVITAQLDQTAISKRIKPDRRLIVVIGSFLGLMLGIIGAFFSYFLEIQRKEEKVNS
jgi:LPS O-antigen subunit length determinant protein (WzzB/FepE family)